MFPNKSLPPSSSSSWILFQAESSQLPRSSTKKLSRMQSCIKRKKMISLQLRCWSKSLWQHPESQEHCPAHQRHFSLQIYLWKVIPIETILTRGGFLPQSIKVGNLNLQGSNDLLNQLTYPTPRATLFAAFWSLRIKLERALVSRLLSTESPLTWLQSKLDTNNPTVVKTSWKWENQSNKIYKGMKPLQQKLSSQFV